MIHNYASNALYAGEATGVNHALRLYYAALCSEARVNELMDAEAAADPHYDARCLDYDIRFTQSLKDDAETVRMLLRGLQGGEGSEELFERWETSIDDCIATIGEVCLEGDFTRFAI